MKLLLVLLLGTILLSASAQMRLESSTEHDEYGYYGSVYDPTDDYTYFTTNSGDVADNRQWSGGVAAMKHV